jgi:O-antigen ligase/tetratricopeptide (TPR) repeat protein
MGAPPGDRSHDWDSALAAAVAALATMAPLAIGSVHPWTQVVLSAAALGVTTVYVLRRGRHGVRLVPFARLLALAAAVTALQLVPLPAPLVHLLSPNAWALRRAVGTPAWMPLTVDVPATLLALARALACLGLLAVTGGLARSRRTSQRLLWLLTLLGGGFALLALCQRAGDVQAIYGFYQPRSQPGFGIFGSFVDVNHAAALLGLLALTAAGVGVEQRGLRRGLALACAALATTALLVSTSRGGLIGFAAGGLVLAAILLGRAFGRARGLASALLLMLVAVAVALWAGEGLRARFLPAATSQLWSNQKTRGWADGLRLAAHYPWTGVGRGAFEAPLRAYRAGNEGVRLVYPENFVVQYAAEWGLVATVALLLVGAWSWRRVVVRTHALAAGQVGAAAGVVAVVVHELMDFGTEMPGVALPAVVALGLVAGRAVARDPHCPRLPLRKSLPIVGAWVLASGASAWAASRTLDEDDLRLQQLARSGAPVEPALATAIARHPADHFLELLAAREALQRHDARAMHHLNRAIELYPADWQAHQLAARLLAAVGRPQQAALEYRQALATGLQPDYGEMTRVLGHFIVDAVPQEPARLVELGRSLAAIGHLPDALVACARAPEQALRREPTLAACVTMALELELPALILPTAKALAAEATEAGSYGLAARGLAAAGQPDAAAALIVRGLRQHGDNAALVLVGAQLRLDAGDLSGASALLTHGGDFTLAERQKMEELLVTVAERAGDSETAVLARARARLIARRIRETSFAPATGERP